MPGLFEEKASVWLEESKLGWGAGRGGGGRKKVKGAAEWPDHMELFPKVPWEAVEGFDQKNEIIPLEFEQDHSC